jgi:hypothetical protein
MLCFTNLHNANVEWHARGTCGAAQKLRGKNCNAIAILYINQTQVVGRVIRQK